jgi:hypothetical protein
VNERARKKANKVCVYVVVCVGGRGDQMHHSMQGYGDGRGRAGSRWSSERAPHPCSPCSPAAPSSCPPPPPPPAAAAAAARLRDATTAASLPATRLTSLISMPKEDAILACARGMTSCGSCLYFLWVRPGTLWGEGEAGGKKGVGQPQQPSVNSSQRGPCRCV